MAATKLQRLSVTRAMQRFFPISKTTFWWTSIKCIQQGVRVALSSLIGSSMNRHWEVRLIKSFEAPFGSSRSRAMFWSCKYTMYNHNINDSLHYRINYKNLTANLLRLSLPFYYWQSHLPYGSADGLLCIQFACLVFQPRLKLVKIDLWIMF